MTRIWKTAKKFRFATPAKRAKIMQAFGDWIWLDPHQRVGDFVNDWRFESYCHARYQARVTSHGIRIFPVT